MIPTDSTTAILQGIVLYFIFFLSGEYLLLFGKISVKLLSPEGYGEHGFTC